MMSVVRVHRKIKSPKLCKNSNNVLCNVVVNVYRGEEKRSKLTAYIIQVWVQTVINIV